MLLWNCFFYYPLNFFFNAYTAIQCGEGKEMERGLNIPDYSVLVTKPAKDVLSKVSIPELTLLEEES